MSKNHLEYSYFLSSGGGPDEMVCSVGSCFPICACLVFKNSFKNPEQYCNIFLNDINVCISQYENNNLKDIYLNESNIINSIFKFKASEKKNSEAMGEIERLLDIGEMVILQTVNQMLPFSRYYAPDFNISDFVPGHSFMVIHHDEKYLYFVEAPELINRSSINCYNANPEIGLMEKEVADKAFQYYCNLYTIKMNFNIFSKLQLNYISTVKNSIKKSITNYYKKSQCKDGIHNYYGREAILRFVDICEKNIIYLNKTAPHGRNYYDYFDWKIWSIIRGRRMLRKCIYEKKEQFKSCKTSEIEGVITHNMELWEKTFRLMGKKYFKGDFALDNSFKKNFINILTSEDEMIEVLKYIV